ncbi:ABC transporter permease [Lottiidibacillus patelloidae]|uniref:ABC transporter permease n=1 Tax=Lottiidibacillus patelloidae TaxID=2670334 RepID=A0A263BS18_9BACI|nr:ABC transporter permease [Lottiidibacillus patelloidae]OZM56494.1 ABC transporter permease [Lottiidibacillus patelloidae]
MRVKALIFRIIKQFFHDKRTLALMIVAPMLILWIMSLVFNGEKYTPHIAIVDVPAQMLTILDGQDLTLTEMSNTEAEKAITSQEVDAIITIEGNSPVITLEGSDPAANKTVLFAIHSALQRTGEKEQLFQPTIHYLHGSDDMAAFDNFGPVLIGFFVFFFVFLISGVAFLRERTGGTLERLLASPLRRWEIVLGYVGGFGIFTLLQATLIAFFSIEVLDMIMVGSFFYVLLITLLLALTALTLGTLLSSFASNELQMIQFIPLVIVPQAFLSGLFNMDTVADWLANLSVIMPLTYGAEALRDVMIRGAGWEVIAHNVYVLLGFSLTFMLANVFALKKHRKI